MLLPLASSVTTEAFSDAATVEPLLVLSSLSELLLPLAELRGVLSGEPCGVGTEVIRGLGEEEEEEEEEEEKGAVA